MRHKNEIYYAYSEHTSKMSWSHLKCCLCAKCVAKILYMQNKNAFVSIINSSTSHTDVRRSERNARWSTKVLRRFRFQVDRMSLRILLVSIWKLLRKFHYYPVAKEIHSVWFHFTPLPRFKQVAIRRKKNKKWRERMREERNSKKTES